MFNLAATRPDLLTGIDPATGKPAPYGSVGVDINCAVIGFTDKAPTANLADPVTRLAVPAPLGAVKGDGGPTPSGPPSHPNPDTRGTLVKRSLMIIVALAAAATLAADLAGGASAARPPGGAAATVSTGSSSLGRILVDGRAARCTCSRRTGGPQRLLRYLRNVLAAAAHHGRPTARGGAAASLLGTIRRADNTTQVTYAGHPLYRYLPDMRPGQTNGQDSHDFGAGWYVLSPAGKKIEAVAVVGNVPRVGPRYPSRYYVR